MKKRILKLFKNPKKALKLVYRKSLGLIIKLNICERRKLEAIDDCNFRIIKMSDIDKIYNFYDSNKMGNLNKKIIKEWLSGEKECWVALFDERIIAAQWFWFGHIQIDHPRRSYFSYKDNFKLDKETAYVCYELVDIEYRGKGIGQYLKNYTLNILEENKGINKIILTTGGSNAPNIRAWMNLGARLIGIIEVKTILGHKIRNELFLDGKEKCWDDI